MVSMMVKIYEEPRLAPVCNGNGLKKSLTDDGHLVDDEGALKDGAIKNGISEKQPVIESDLPRADLTLVKEVRVLLERMHDEMDAAEFDETYSRRHYDELMDSASPNTCWRYLIQRDMDVDAAYELAKQTLAWRKENRIDVIQSSEMIKDYWLRTPVGFTGRSKNGNDVVYAIGKNFRKPGPSVKQTIRDFISYLLFDWDRKHRHDLAQFELVFDVSDTGFRNIDLDFSYWLVSIRDFLPARTKVIYFVGIPFLLRPVIKLIISWLPERFRKIVECGTYDELVRANIDDDSIPEEIGGKADNKWRLAPIGSKWAHEHENPDAPAIFEKICKACSFNTSQEQLDKLYKMQMDYESRHTS